MTFAPQPLPAISQPAPDATRLGWRDRLPSGQRLWWTLAILVIALAVGFCAWLTRELWMKPSVLAPGASYTDRLGVTYQVVGVETLTEVPDGTGVYTAPPGAILLRYAIAVDNYVWIEGHPDATVCSFDLVRDDGETWMSLFYYDEHRTKICRTDEEEITDSQQVYAVFQVTEDQLDRIVGLVSNTRPNGSFPILSPP